MPNLATYRTYRGIAKNCLANHRESSTAMAAGAMKVRKEGAIQQYNEMVATLAEMRENHPVPRKEAVPVRGRTDEALGILLSDLHFGKFSEIDNEVVYSIEIAKRRFEGIIQNARHLWGAYMKSTHEIEDIHIFLVGDIIDGEQIYRTQAWNAELPVVKQVTMAASILKTSLINWAAKEFTNVYIHSVQGNHGEIRESGGESAFHWQTNFDTILACMVEFATADMKNVHWDIGYDRLHIARIPKYKVEGEHRFFMMHKTPVSPQTAAGRSKFGGWHQRFKVDCFLTGHYHNFRYENFNGIPILYNGAMFGSADDYTMNLAYDGYPSQTLFSIADKRPVAQLWSVDLRELQ